MFTYTYITEIFRVFLILIEAGKGFRRAKERKIKDEIILITIGMIVFLTAFSWGNLIGNITDDWSISQYGLFGVPIFIGFLAYAVVRYGTLGIHLSAVQVIITAIAISVGTQLFFIQANLNRIITSITLVSVVIFGLMLIRSIKKEEREKRRELEKINKELLKIDQTKSEFINIASHQLRTPVTVIKGVISMMKSGKMDRLTEEEKKIFINSAWNKGQKLEEIIKDILNAASLTNKKYLVSKEMMEEMDISELVRQVINDFRSESERTAIPVVFQKEGDNFLVSGIKEDLREAFNNLLNNAFKYTSSEEGKIDIFIQEKDREILISIQDNGIGIPKEEIPKLFEKFYRASNAKKMYTDGSGLGLFIVKEIVEGHGGKVWVESEVDKGTRFLVRLKRVGLTVQEEGDNIVM